MTDVDRALQNMKGNAARARERTGVPGIAVAVVHVDGDTVKDEFVNVGTTTANGSATVGSDTVFQLASVSKPIATTIAAWLFSRGNGSWGDRAALRAVLRLADPNVTLGALFAHRSGLPEHAGDLLEDMGYRREDILRRLQQLQLWPVLDQSAGPYASCYAYTNFGFTGAAVAAAAAAGGAWEALAASVLYEPLEMHSTSSRYEDFAAHVDSGRAAVPHQRMPRPLAGQSPALPPEPRWDRPAELRNADAQSPAGGVSSTTEDLSRWMRLQLGLHDSAHFDEAFRTQLDVTHTPYPPGASYGMGWNVSPGDGSRPAQWSHSGAFTLGAATCVTLLPDSRTGIAVLTNGQPIGVPEAICHAFSQDLTGASTSFDEILEYVAGRFLDELYPRPEPHPDRRSPAHPPRAAAEYEGTYLHDFYGPLQVAGSGSGKLDLTMGPAGAGQTCPLEPWDGDTFLYTPPGENGGDPSAVTFATGPDQRIIGVGVEHLFEPYSAGDAAADPEGYVSDVWEDVHTVDTRLSIEIDGFLRSWTFYALNDHPVSLVVYRRSGEGYTVRDRTPYEKPRPKQLNKFFTGAREVRAGDLIGFHQPEQGSIAFKLAPAAAWNRGKGNLDGRVLFTSRQSGSEIDFEYSSDRVYLIEVEVVFGLRGSAVAVRQS